MSDEVKKRVPKRRAAPPSPEVKRERFARLYDAQVAVYEGMGVDAADLMKEHRELFLNSPELLALVYKFRPEMTEEEAREYGAELGRIINSLLPKVRPFPSDVAEACVETLAALPVEQPCPVCTVDFVPPWLARESELSFEERGKKFVLRAFVETPDGEGGYWECADPVCPRCTLKLCKEVVIKSEKDGQFKE